MDASLNSVNSAASRFVDGSASPAMSSPQPNTSHNGIVQGRTTLAAGDRFTQPYRKNITERLTEKDRRSLQDTVRQLKIRGVSDMVEEIACRIFTILSRDQEDDEPIPPNEEEKKDIYTEVNRIIEGAYNQPAPTIAPLTDEQRRFFLEYVRNSKETFDLSDEVNKFELARRIEEKLTRMHNYPTGTLTKETRDGLWQQATSIVHEGLKELDRLEAAASVLKAPSGEDKEIIDGLINSAKSLIYSGEDRNNQIADCAIQVNFSFVLASLKKLDCEKRPMEMAKTACRCPMITEAIYSLAFFVFVNNIDPEGIFKKGAAH